MMDLLVITITWVPLLFARYLDAAVVQIRLDVSPQTCNLHLGVPDVSLQQCTCRVTSSGLTPFQLDIHTSEACRGQSCPDPLGQRLPM